jgi:hypothetical protein
MASVNFNGLERQAKRIQDHIRSQKARQYVPDIHVVFAGQDYCSKCGGPCQVKANGGKVIPTKWDCALTQEYGDDSQEEEDTDQVQE